MMAATYLCEPSSSGSQLVSLLLTAQHKTSFSMLRGPVIRLCRFVVCSGFVRAFCVNILYVLCITCNLGPFYESGLVWGKVK